MIEVTPEDVVKIAPEFTTLAETEAGEIQIETMILLARDFVCESKFGSKAKNAITFLAAHFLTDLIGDDGAGTSGASGPVTMEKVGDLQRSYGSVDATNLTAGEKMFASTKYGRIFIAIRRTLTFTPMVL